MDANREVKKLLAMVYGSQPLTTAQTKAAEKLVHLWGCMGLPPAEVGRGLAIMLALLEAMQALNGAGGAPEAAVVTPAQSVVAPQPQQESAPLPIPPVEDEQADDISEDVEGAGELETVSEADRDVAMAEEANDAPQETDWNTVPAETKVVAVLAGGIEYIGTYLGRSENGKLRVTFPDMQEAVEFNENDVTVFDPTEEA